MKRGAIKISRKLAAFFLSAVGFIILAAVFTFFHSPSCADLECFQNAMKECKRARYINEAQEASWRYEILGLREGQCDIRATLLQPKAGELVLEKLSGFDMICTFPGGISTYPERDIERCHGRLKEELQKIVINRLHKYLIENLGEIEESIEVFS